MVVFPPCKHLLYIYILQGVPLEMLLKHGSCSKASTFMKLYSRDIMMSDPNNRSEESMLQRQ